MESVTTLRKKRRKSQVALAQDLGVHPTTISQYEHGRSTPSLERFASLCEALDVGPKRMLAALKEAKRARTASASVTNLQEERSRREPQVT